MVIVGQKQKLKIKSSLGLKLYRKQLNQYFRELIKMVNQSELIIQLNTYVSLAVTFWSFFVILLIMSVVIIAQLLTILENSSKSTKKKILATITTILSILTTYFCFSTALHYHSHIEKLPYKFASEHSLDVCEVFKFLTSSRKGYWCEVYFNHCIVDKEKSDKKQGNNLTHSYQCFYPVDKQEIVQLPLILHPITYHLMLS